VLLGGLPPPTLSPQVVRSTPRVAGADDVV
jgi:hypothetical protein